MDDIDKLLNKYFEGETSLNEEKWLRDYFNRKNLPEQYEEYAPMFRHFAAKIESQSNEERINPIARNRKMLFFFKYSSIAACILIALLIGLGRYTNHNSSVAYINGKEYRNSDIINIQALNSIDNITSVNNETIDSQIEIIDSFLE